MILSDDEINLLVREASRNSAINRDGTTSQRIARAIEAKVLEKLGDKIRDAERYEWLREQHWSDKTLTVTKSKYVEFGRLTYSLEMLDQAIDAAIKESK